MKTIEQLKEKRTAKRREYLIAQVAEFKAKCKGMKLTKRDRPYSYDLVFKWTVSRAADAYGYNICTLLVNGVKVASCNGGGYDMQGTVLGQWIQNAFPERLYKRIKSEMYGISFHDPLWVRPKRKPEDIAGLDQYRVFHAASSKTPTTKHVAPLMNGGCGIDCMKRIGEQIGLTFKWLPQSDRFKNYTFYTVTDNLQEA